MSSKYLEWQDQDYYAMMGVTRMATEDDIRKAFRMRAKECHPDRFPNSSPEREQAAEYFKRLCVIRDILLDPELRAEYDKEQDLVQQAYFDSVVFEVPQPEQPPPRGKVPSFIEALKDAYTSSQSRDFYSSVDYTIGHEEHDPYEAYYGDDNSKSKGVPQASRKNAANFYYSQGLRYAARGQYRRALYALNNAKMLNPDLHLPEHVMSKIRSQAYYS